ncbi:MAG: hypothetical protein JSW41_01645, partial [Candidatus Aenigmatarchaeota archaeon]
MNKITNITLNSKHFVQYARAISGLFLATKGEPLTDTDVKLLYLIKLGFRQKKIDYISKQLRAELSHLLELKPQTLYNRISELKKKGALITETNQTKLAPMFGDRMSVNINYN